MNKSEMELIQSKIFVVRGMKVIFDRDLAELYGVETRILNQAVKRNQERFPVDFYFQLNKNEWDSLRSQFVILEGPGKHSKYLPSAFTQNGIAMLSSVLKSKKAIEVNINIMRVFVKTSELLRNQAAIYQKIEKISREGEKNSKDIEQIFSLIDGLTEPKVESESRRKIGFD